MSTCKNCGNTIVWHRSYNTGRPYPANSSDRRDFHRCNQRPNQPVQAPITRDQVVSQMTTNQPVQPRYAYQAPQAPTRRDNKPTGANLNMSVSEAADIFRSLTQPAEVEASEDTAPSVSIVAAPVVSIEPAVEVTPQVLADLYLMTRSEDVSLAKAAHERLLSLFSKTETKTEVKPALPAFATIPQNILNLTTKVS